MLLGLRGLDAPWLVGIAAGLIAIAAPGARSRRRAVAVASAGVWVAVLIEVGLFPRAKYRGLIDALVRFHHSVTPLRLLAYLACFAVAFALIAAWSRDVRDGTP